MTISPDQLHVIRCYLRLPPLPGGMERHVAELTAAQRRQGVRVTEVFNTGEPTGEGIRVWPAIKLEKVHPSRLRWLLFYSSPLLRRIDLSDGRFTVVHAHGDWPAFALAASLGQRIGASAVAASLHARFHAPLRRYASALRQCEPIFTTGLEQARCLEESLGRPVHHLPSGPQDLFFSKRGRSSKNIDVVAIGSLLPVKNLDLLMECAAICPELRFAIVGDGPDRRRLEKLGSDHGLKNVVFYGSSSPQEVCSVLLSARLFVNTSYSEGSPTAALEAMACGLPVVLTPSNDYSSIVKSGLNGIVTSGWTAHELVTALRWFLSDSRRLDKARATSHAIAVEHRWESKAQFVTKMMAAKVERRTIEDQ